MTQNKILQREGIARGGIPNAPPPFLWPWFGLVSTKVVVIFRYSKESRLHLFLILSVKDHEMLSDNKIPNLIKSLDLFFTYISGGTQFLMKRCWYNLSKKSKTLSIQAFIWTFTGIGTVPYIRSVTHSKEVRNCVRIT